MTYSELDRQARAVAGALQARKAQGERVVLMFPPGPAYVVVFLGCLYAGAVAVPVYPPSTASSKTWPRLRAILLDSRAALALTTSEILPLARSLLGEVPELSGLRLEVLEESAGASLDAWEEVPLSNETLAFLQYTSGSTGTPKGVAITHGNLLHNSELIRRSFDHTRDDRGVIWLPPYHDMGLIGGILQPLYVGFPVYLMSASSFIRRPARWLETISAVRGTISGGPDFAYELCARSLTLEQRQRLDLSSWRVAFTGAEPVRATTLERFSRVFAPCGFRREALMPVYGLAESTLLVTRGERGSPPRVQTFRGDALERGRAEAGLDGEPASRPLVGCGKAEGQQVEIVDPETRIPRAPNEVGEIWIRGESVASGYWGRPEETAATFQARLTGDESGATFLRTGDLGFLRDGALFVTGRLKDLIIIRGRNLYPPDIEQEAERAHLSIRPGRVAAFAVERQGQERLVVLAERRPQEKPESLARVASSIRRAITEVFGVDPESVVVLRGGTLPITSSGKLERRMARARYLAGDYSDEGHRGDSAGIAPRDDHERWVAEVWRQVLGLASVGVTDDFFTVGGDSVSAVRVAAKLTELGLALTVPELLQAPTIEAQAERLRTQRAGKAVVAPPPAGGTRDRYPLTPMQQSMLFQVLRPGGERQYVTQARLHLARPLALEALRAAWVFLVARHAVFRTAICVEGFDEPAQQVLLNAPAHVDELDFSAETPERSKVLIEGFLEQDRQRGFVWSAPPLMRLTQLRSVDGKATLVWTCHHLLIDGWSQGRLLEELSFAYAACLEGRPLSLPVIRPFGDLLTYLEQQPADTAQAFWKATLAGAAVPNPVGVEGLYPFPETARLGARAALSVELKRRLALVARECGVGLATLYAGAWALLLGRYLGSADVLFGTAVSGRPAQLAGAESMVGMFIEAVPLRPPPPEGALGPWLQSVQARWAQAQDHAHYPHRQLAQWAGLPPGQPLFDALLVMENFPLDAALLSSAGPLGVEHVEIVDDTHDPFTLTVRSWGARAELILSGAAQRFHPSTLGRVLRHLEALLQGMADGVALARLPALAVEDGGELAGFEHGPPLVQGELPQLLTLLEERARQLPEVVAVVQGERSLTYAELDRRANHLAHALRARGVGPEVVVPVVAPRSVEGVLGMMAVMKAGGAFAPLDAGHPPARVREVLEELGARVALAAGAPAMRESVEAVCPHVLWIDAQATSTGPDEPPAAVHRPENLAYVIYTSGTTGRAKGVMVEHRSVSHVAACWNQVYGLPGSGLRLLQVGSFGADVFIGDWIKVVLAAGTLVILPDEDRLDLVAVHRLMEKHRITGLESTPGYVVSLAAFLYRKGLVPRWLRLVILGADSLRTEEFRKLRQRLGSKVRVVNGYGLTECTIESSLYEPAAELATPRSGYVPLGRPFPGVHYRVLDTERRAVPIGRLGELYIGGPLVARGYLNQPELSAEKFIEGPSPGERLYRTGDLARWSVDGQIEHHGRADNLVKLRGHRVELGEIENALLLQSVVRQAAVVPDESCQSLIAYVAVEPSADLEDVQAALRARLPEYMVPTRFVTVDALPVSANGKVDRRALAQLALLAPPLPPPGPEAPLSHLEAALATMWKELLHVDSVGLDDSFLTLGGTSLKVLELYNRLQSELDAKIEVADLFSHHTIRWLARLLESKR